MPSRQNYSYLAQHNIPFDQGVKLESIKEYEQYDKDKYWVFETGGVHPLKGLKNVPEMYNKETWPYVLAVTENRFIKIVPHIPQAGAMYPRVNLSRKQSNLDPISKDIHRIIANAFVKNPKNLPVVNHLNKNRIDYRIENLEWTTIKDNAEGPSPVNMEELFERIQMLDWWKINRHDETFEHISKKQKILITSKQMELNFNEVE